MARQHISEQRKKRKRGRSLDLKTATESLLKTVFGSEFQTPAHSIKMHVSHALLPPLHLVSSLLLVEGQHNSLV